MNGGKSVVGCSLELMPMEDIEDQFARNLQALMDAYSLTQAKLGERVGVSEQQIRNYLKKRRFPGPIMLARIADVFGIKAGLLISSESVTIGQLTLEDIARKAGYKVTIEPIKPPK